MINKLSAGRIVVSANNDSSMMSNTRLINKMDSSSSIALLFFCFVSFSSCLKSTDNTNNGPKSLVAITNFVVNSSINITLDNGMLTTAPLGFGMGIGTGTGGYTALGAGLHNLQLGSGTGTVTNNTISTAAGTNYSLFIYDTLQTNKVKKIMLTDDLTAIDTVGRARFLQFIPGADSLTLTLKKDTTYTFADKYVGNKAAVTMLDFATAIKPGNYEVKLQRKGTTIYLLDSLTITAGKLYSLISKGVVNGTAEYKEAVTVVRHN